MEKKKILLIEDNFEVRENTAEILGLSGYKVLTASNGKIGVDLARTHLPDLIICDIMMPELDGYGVLHILSKNDQTASIPFVFLTARSERSDFRKGMIMGADDYLTKPFDDVELLNVIEIRLRKTELLRRGSENGSMGFDELIDHAKIFKDLKNGKDESNIRRFRKKEAIFSSGQYPSGAYLLRNGMVKTFISNQDGKEFVTAILKEGDFLGYIELLEERPYNESAQALEDTELTFIPRTEFNALLCNNREISRKFISILSGSLLDQQDKLIKLAYNSVRKRVAEALAILYDSYGKEGEEVVFSVSREDLASMVGTATESAIRALSDFKEEGLVEIMKGDIRILDIEKLKKVRN